MSIHMEPCRWFYLKGKLVLAEQANLSVTTHALNYGTAAFETLRLYKTPSGPRLLGLSEHLARLQHSQRVLGLNPVDERRIRKGLSRVIAQNQLEECYLRLLLFADGECSSLDPAVYVTDFLIIPWRCKGFEFAPPMTLGVSKIRRPSSNCLLPKAKLTGGYILDAVAHQAARTEGFDNALILHDDGIVCEAAGANIFLVKDGNLQTPIITHTLDGITRRLVMDIASSLKLSTKERRLLVTDFKEADEVFITGTYHGIRTVSAVDGVKLFWETPGPVTRSIQTCFHKMLDEPDSVLAQNWLSPVRSELETVITPSEPSFWVRPAAVEEVSLIIKAIEMLLAELRGVPACALHKGAKNTCQRLIDGTSPGAVLIAKPREDSTRLVGVIALAVLEAIHTGGFYALIQDLWVVPEFRDKGVGTALIKAAEVFCRKQKLTTLEVCLPKPSFPNLPRTYRFYEATGFVEMGPRMRKVIS